MHISKPHLDGGALVLNVLNPTAGLLAGDEIASDVRVDAGARLVLTMPSASRAHRMRNGRAAVKQKFSIAGGSALEIWPELFIPQCDTRYAQTTHVDIRDDGELMFWELLAPGRVASGEAFRYSELVWSTEVRLNERLILRERFALVPGEASVETWRAVFPTGYYASGIIISPLLSATASVWGEIHNLHSATAWVGCSSLTAGGGTIRVLASDSVALRHILHEIRQRLYCALGRPVPALRRIGESPVASEPALHRPTHGLGDLADSRDQIPKFAGQEGLFTIALREFG
jgi:urease accessory protein